MRKGTTKLHNSRHENLQVFFESNLVIFEIDAKTLKSLFGGGRGSTLNFRILGMSDGSSDCQTASNFHEFS